MTNKVIWMTRVMAVIAFFAVSFVVYQIIVNTVTRAYLCDAITKENREVLAPQVQKGLEQTKHLKVHIKGYDKQQQIRQGKHFLEVLNKPVC